MLRNTFDEDINQRTTEFIKILDAMMAEHK
jgi:hypothetical protein